MKYKTFFHCTLASMICWFILAGYILIINDSLFVSTPSILMAGAILVLATFISLMFVWGEELDELQLKSRQKEIRW